MNCNDFRRELHAYHLDRLEPAGESALLAHAGACPACQALFALASELSCRDFVEFLDDYLEGGLEPARRAVFERHLAVCRDCVAYLDSYREVVRLAALSGGAPQPPGGTPEELVQAILAARRAR
jgi:anti-sigma factor RsiW